MQQLREARDKLADLIREIDSDDNGFGVFQAQLPFIYRNLNLAWNSTRKSDEEFFRAFQESQGSSREFYGFPHDLDPFIHD